MRRLIVGLALLCVCSLVAACNSGSSEPAAAPKGLPPFYAVPAGVAHKAAGTLLKSEPVSAPDIHGSVQRVMYVSTDARGKSAAVTGTVFIPALPPPPTGYPVVTWAHGANGMAPRCTPSLNPTDAVLAPAIANAMLALGWEVVATDYQGEGTPPGLLPFLVGDTAARNTIDIVLAASELPTAHTAMDYAVWGHSEGGQSALFAWRLATTYGARRGMHMVGAVAAAPPSQLQKLYEHLSGTPNRVYDLMMLAGFNVAYGNKAAPLDAVLTQKGKSLLPTLRKSCLASASTAVNAGPFTELVKTTPFDVPAWKQLFTQNDASTFQAVNQVPLLIVHGGADEIIPADTSAGLADELCASGANLERWVYPQQTHGGVLFVAGVDMGRWIASHFQKSPVAYRPTAPGVEVRGCR
jgi:pimeloyl-ACP methyl ester carboxylesterase